MILWFYITPTVGQSQCFDFDFWLFSVKSKISILKTSYLVYLYHFHSLHLIFTSLKRILNVSLTKSTLQLKSTMLSVDRPHTYTLLDYISYICEFSFINFVWLTFCVFNDCTKMLRQHALAPHWSLTSGWTCLPCALPPGCSQVPSPSSRLPDCPPRHHPIRRHFCWPSVPHTNDLLRHDRPGIAPCRLASTPHFKV